jgi:DNA-directed RNA polymerase specialized sigma24 family protein
MVMSYKHSDTIDRDRAICELYEWHDWSYRKLGALFGITFGRVRQIIDRSISDIRMAVRIDGEF